MKHFGELRLSRPFTADPKRRQKRMWQVKANPDVMIRLKRLFPRADHLRSGEILLYDTPEVARDLQWVTERWPLRADAGAVLYLAERAQEHRRLEQTVHAILSGERRDLGLREPARPARDYQQVAADLAVTTGHLLLMDEFGLGKSFTSLLVLLVPEALPALVVTLTDMPDQWVEEIAKTLPWLRVHRVRQLQPYDPARRRDMGGQDPDVLIMPWSKLRGWGDHLAGRVRTVIFDEVQELRRPDSLKYAAAAQVADAAQFVMGLSATPIYNYGGEAHNIVEAVAPGQLGSREEFAREWCGGQWHDKVRVTDPAALGIYLRDQGIMLRRTRKEVGRELPEVIRVPHTISLDQDTLNRLSADAVDLADAILGASATREERFLASGQLDWRLRHATGVAKAPFVAEFVKLLVEAEEQVVLYGWHHDCYSIWAERLQGANPLFHTGLETPNQKRRHREAFIDGECRVLVMSLRTGAGIDGLQDACKVAVFGELDWSPGIHEQCISRLNRDNSDGTLPEEPVVAYFLVAEDGSDPVVAEVLNLKRMQSEPIHDPDAFAEGAPLAAAVGTEDRVRRLAEDVLRRRRAR